MKRLLLIIAATMAVAARAEEFNPHAEFTKDIETKWNHKDIPERPLTPENIKNFVDDFQYQWARPKGANRPTMSHIIPVARPPYKAGAPWTFGVLEDWQLERFNGYYIRTESEAIKTFQLFYPKFTREDGRVFPETYAIWMDRDGRNSIDILPRFPVDHISFGKAIEVNQAGRIVLTPSVYINPPNKEGVASISLGAAILEQKGGEKYLRVYSGGKKYGLKLELLD